MIVIVLGLPGSGKSFFAERFAERIQAVYLSSDRIRIEMQNTAKYSLSDKLMVYREMLQRTAQRLDNGERVVVDGTFYNHTMREMFIDVGKQKNSPLFLIEVVADEDVIRDRLEKPRKYSEADFSVYEVVRDEFEEITMPHLVVKSTNDNIDVMIDKALKYIGIL